MTFQQTIEAHERQGQVRAASDALSNAMRNRKAYVEAGVRDRHDVCLSWEDNEDADWLE
jgi:hypothetical protein